MKGDNLNSFVILTVIKVKSKYDWKLVILFYSIVKLSINVAVSQTFKIHMFKRLEDTLFERHVVDLFEFIAYVITFI